MTARVAKESALRVSACVTELLRKQPFFGSLALRLPLRADAGRETLAANGHEIRYSPRWVADTDAHLIEAAIARVVLACALKHHTRRGRTRLRALADGLAARHPCAHSRRGVHAAARRRSLGGAERRGGLRPPAGAGRWRPRGTGRCVAPGRRGCRGRRTVRCGRWRRARRPVRLHGRRQRRQPGCRRAGRSRRLP